MVDVVFLSLNESLCILLFKFFTFCSCRSFDFSRAARIRSLIFCGLFRRVILTHISYIGLDSEIFNTGSRIALICLEL